VKCDVAWWGKKKKANMKLRFRRNGWVLKNIKIREMVEFAMKSAVAWWGKKKKANRKNGYRKMVHRSCRKVETWGKGERLCNVTATR
jgi:hypothetical protein